MKKTDRQTGFSAIELLITLFIAAAFLISGYQLYSLVIKDNSESRMQAKASNVSADYLKQYKSSATNPCTTQSPLTNAPISVAGLSSVSVTVSISCPYGSTSVSKISVTTAYDNPQKTVTTATYVNL